MGGSVEKSGEFLAIRVDLDRSQRARENRKAVASKVLDALRSLFYNSDGPAVQLSSPLLPAEGTTEQGRSAEGYTSVARQRIDAGDDDDETSGNSDYTRTIAEKVNAIIVALKIRSLRRAKCSGLLLLSGRESKAMG